MQSYRLISTL